VISRCPELGDLNETRHTDIYASSRNSLRNALEAARNKSKLVSLLVYAVITEQLVPSWKFLPKEMRLKSHLRESANEILQGIVNATRNKNPNNTEVIKL
jgi:hypothetical protein